MCNDRIPSVNDPCIVAAFIEHTHVQSKHVCKIYSAVCSAFVRTDRHHMITVDLQILYSAEKPFDKLIGRRYSFKTAERDCILNPRIVSVKCDDVFYSHADKLLKCKSTVERLS